MLWVYSVPTMWMVWVVCVVFICVWIVLFGIFIIGLFLAESIYMYSCIAVIEEMCRVNWFGYTYV